MAERSRPERAKGSTGKGEGKIRPKKSGGNSGGNQSRGAWSRPDENRGKGGFRREGGRGEEHPGGGAQGARGEWRRQRPDREGKDERPGRSWNDGGRESGRDGRPGRDRKDFGPGGAGRPKRGGGQDDRGGRFRGDRENSASSERPWRARPAKGEERGGGKGEWKGRDERKDYGGRGEWKDRGDRKDPAAKGGWKGGVERKGAGGWKGRDDRKGFAPRGEWKGRDERKDQEGKGGWKGGDERKGAGGWKGRDDRKGFAPRGEWKGRDERKDQEGRGGWKGGDERKGAGGWKGRDDRKGFAPRGDWKGKEDRKDQEGRGGWKGGNERKGAGGWKGRDDRKDYGGRGEWKGRDERKDPVAKGEWKGKDERREGQEINERKGRPDRPQKRTGQGFGGSHPGKENPRKMTGAVRPDRPKRAVRDDESGNAPTAGKKDPIGERPVRRAKTVREEEGKTRLNKAIADAGIASRRKADEMIAAGRVRVNGAVVTELGMQVERSDRIEVEGKLIGNPDRERYILLNKPKDTITTTSDERGRMTVLDLVEAHERLFPVGRLDRNTTGVLLLTNDGDLAYRMTHPSYEVERVYDVTLDKEIALGDARTIAQGVPLGNGETSQPCYISVEDGDRRNVTVVLREGKNREVRRMFEARGYDVKKLNRVSYAGITCQGLQRGEWRELKKHEVRELRKRLKLE